MTNTIVVSLGNNPLSTINGDRTVVVTSPAHGLTTGTTVTISGASNVGGRSINGTYTITRIDANRYSVEISRTARSTQTGGGNSVRESHDVTTSVTRNVWFYADYTANPASPPDTCQADGAYTVAVPTTAAQRQNVANWHSYYRTRILMMKTASGRAFATVDDKYRVGFTAISEKGTNSARFLNLKKFDATQKSDWYTLLYSQTPSGYTPLRGALSKAGRLYAGKLVTGNNDPVQYSCQQNFTILTTDGYWNTNNESPANNGTGGNASSNYGPYREDNVTKVGNADSGLAAPFGDTYTNTLADVAMYYYNTDLRPFGSIGGLPDGGTTRLDVSEDNVPIVSNLDPKFQHMNVFTIGLGVSGTSWLDYNENYLNGGSTGYNSILSGTSWPNPDTTSTSTTVVARIDDLWHAAVNGRGRYLSASNPDSVVSALSKALAAISVKSGLRLGRRDQQPRAGGGRQLRLRRPVHDQGLVRRPAGQGHRAGHGRAVRHGFVVGTGDAGGQDRCHERHALDLHLRHGQRQQHQVIRLGQPDGGENRELLPVERLEPGRKTAAVRHLDACPAVNCRHAGRDDRLHPRPERPRG